MSIWDIFELYFCLHRLKLNHAGNNSGKKLNMTPRFFSSMKFIILFYFNLHYSQVISFTELERIDITRYSIILQTTLLHLM